MTIYVANTGEIKCYSGDSGNIQFKGIPTDKNYQCYFSVKEAKTNNIIFEVMRESNQQDMISFDISAEETKKLKVSNGASYNIYYYGLKICDPETKLEDTLIPMVKLDENNNPIFAKPTKFIVYPMYVEGLNDGGTDTE